MSVLILKQATICITSDLHKMQLNFVAFRSQKNVCFTTCMFNFMQDEFKNANCKSIKILNTTEYATVKRTLTVDHMYVCGRVYVCVCVFTLLFVPVTTFMLTSSLRMTRYSFK